MSFFFCKVFRNVFFSKKRLYAYSISIQKSKEKKFEGKQNFQSNENNRYSKVIICILTYVLSLKSLYLQSELDGLFNKFQQSQRKK